MPRRSTPIEWVVFAALGFAWGSSYLFIKIGVETLTPFTLVAARTAIGAAVLGAVLWISRERLPRTRSAYVHMLVVAVLGIALPFSLITWGEQTIDSGLAAILNGSVPLFAIVLAAIVLTDEPITLNRLVGLLVGFGGVVMITSPSFSSGLGGSVPGELALIGASVSYAAVGVYARHTVRDLPPLTSAFLEVGLAFLVVVILAFGLENPLGTHVEASTILAVSWLGLIGSGLAFLGFFYLLGRWGATRTSTIAYVLPVVGIALGVTVRQETVSLPVVAGMVLIIGGVALANSGFGHRRLIGRREPATQGEGTVQAGE
jgi:drug/metabolite transporter (DMT)-like permease